MIAVGSEDDVPERPLAVGELVEEPAGRAGRAPAPVLRPADHLGVTIAVDMKLDGASGGDRRPGAAARAEAIEGAGGLSSSRTTRVTAFRRGSRAHERLDERPAKRASSSSLAPRAVLRAERRPSLSAERHLHERELLDRADLGEELLESVRQRSNAAPLAGHQRDLGAVTRVRAIALLRPLP